MGGARVEVPEWSNYREPAGEKIQDIVQKISKTEVVSPSSSCFWSWGINLKNK